MRDCDNCKHMKHYITGMDEYPPCTTIPYCAKGVWHDDPQIEPDESAELKDCTLFEPKQEPTK